MKAGKANTTPLPIDFKKLRAFTKFSKVNIILNSAQNLSYDLHRLTNPIKTNPRTRSLIQANRHQL